MLTEATTSTTTTTIASLGLTTTIPLQPVRTTPATTADEQMDQSPSIRQMNECSKSNGMSLVVIRKMKQMQSLSNPLLCAQTPAQGFERDLSRSD